MKTLWAHTIVKNEDQYLYFAIKSIIDHAEKILLYDTGSTDNTVSIIEALKKEYPGKISFEEKGAVDPKSLTLLRQEMLDKTTSDWFILLDGDEVWWEDSIKEIVKVINTKGDDLYALVSPVINLVGDIYHYQEEKAGKYKILGKEGHFNIRAINRKISGLNLKNDYPLEGYYDKENNLIQSVSDKLYMLENPILHFSFLNRSSNKDKNILHRNKLKAEIGNKFPKNFKYPEALLIKRPDFINDPFKKMGLGFKIKSQILTPFKKIKRRLR